MFQQAIDSYRAALALNPSLEAAKKGLEASEGLLQIAEAAVAHKEMEQKRALQEENLNDPVIAGVVAAAQKDEKSALESYQAGVRLYEKGAFQEAKKHFTLAVADNPSLASARKGLIASEALARISDASSVNRQPVDTLKEMAAGTSRKGRAIGIEVSNGNGASHMARDIAEYLKAKGFTVVRLTNADNFNHAEGSIVFEKEYEELAGQIAGAIPHIKDVKQTGQIGPAERKSEGRRGEGPGVPPRGVQDSEELGKIPPSPLYERGGIVCAYSIEGKIPLYPPFAKGEVLHPPL